MLDGFIVPCLYKISKRKKKQQITVVAFVVWLRDEFGNITVGLLNYHWNEQCLDKIEFRCKGNKQKCDLRVKFKLVSGSVEFDCSQDIGEHQCSRQLDSACVIPSYWGYDKSIAVKVAECFGYRWNHDDNIIFNEILGGQTKILAHESWRVSSDCLWVVLETERCKKRTRLQ